MLCRLQENARNLIRGLIKGKPGKRGTPLPVFSLYSRAHYLQHICSILRVLIYSCISEIPGSRHENKSAGSSK